MIALFSGFFNGEYRLLHELSEGTVDTRGGMPSDPSTKLSTTCSEKPLMSVLPALLLASRMKASSKRQVAVYIQRRSYGKLTYFTPQREEWGNRPILGAYNGMGLTLVR